MGSKWWMKPPEKILGADLPKSKSFFGWSKKVSGLTRFVGQVRIPSRILFFTERKRFWLTSHKFHRSAINSVVDTDLENWLKEFVWHSGSFLQGPKKIMGGFCEPKTTITSPLRSERAFWNARFAFCVLTVLFKGGIQTHKTIMSDCGIAKMV